MTVLELIVGCIPAPLAANNGSLDWRVVTFFSCRETRDWIETDSNLTANSESRRRRRS